MGIEPKTIRSQSACSANCAKEALHAILNVKMYRAWRKTRGSHASRCQHLRQFAARRVASRSLFGIDCAIRYWRRYILLQRLEIIRAFLTHARRQHDTFVSSACVANVMCRPALENCQAGTALRARSVGMFPSRHQRARPPVLQSTPKASCQASSRPIVRWTTCNIIHCRRGRAGSPSTRWLCWPALMTRK